MRLPRVQNAVFWQHYRNFVPSALQTCSAIELVNAFATNLISDWISMALTPLVHLRSRQRSEEKKVKKTLNRKDSAVIPTAFFRKISGQLMSKKSPKTRRSLWSIERRCRGAVSSAGCSAVGAPPPDLRLGRGSAIPVPPIHHAVPGGREVIENSL